MAIPWTTLKSLLIFFGPWLLPRAIGAYRRIQAAARQQQQQQQRPQTRLPVRRQTAVVLAAVLAGAVLCFASAGLLPALPVWWWPTLPDNIFAATGSRLQTPTDVLFTRLAALRRPGAQLTPADEALRARFASLESRLLYLQFGPDVLAACPFCAGTGVDSGTGSGSSGSSTAYLYYALIGLAAQHLAVLVLVTAATTPLVVLGRMPQRGPVAARVRRWSLPAAAAVLLVAAVDVALLVLHDTRANARAVRAAELELYFWTAQRARGAAEGLLLAGLAGVLYCSVTGWVPAVGPQADALLRLVLLGAEPAAGPAERVTATTRALAATRGRLNAAAIVKNTALRDADLRGRTQTYWAREVALVAAAMEEREVVEGVQDALLHRLDMQQMERDAALYVHNVVPVAGP